MPCIQAILASSSKEVLQHALQQCISLRTCRRKEASRNVFVRCSFFSENKAFCAKTQCFFAQYLLRFSNSLPRKLELCMRVLLLCALLASCRPAGGSDGREVGAECAGAASEPGAAPLAPPPHHRSPTMSERSCAPDHTGKPHPLTTELGSMASKLLEMKLLSAAKVYARSACDADPLNAGKNVGRNISGGCTGRRAHAYRPAVLS